jgi:cytochrome c
MKIIRIMLICLLIVGLATAVALAKQHTPEERGRTLFNDAKFAGGTKACNSCHADGKGLEYSADKKEFGIMGKTQKSLEEAVNFCIVNANKGKAIDPKSDQMKDLVAYIKSLKKGKTEAKPEAKKPAAGY